MKRTDPFQQVAELQAQYNALLETDRHLRRHLVCTRTDPERDLKPHGNSAVCMRCYELLQVDLAKVSLVAGSISSIVYEWMRQGRACPFCNGIKAHTSTCYLSFNAGRGLLDEYQAIETHRDMLLSRTEEEAQPPRNGHATSVSRLSIKARFRHRVRA